MQKNHFENNSIINEIFLLRLVLIYFSTVSITLIFLEFFLVKNGKIKKCFHLYARNFLHLLNSSSQHIEPEERKATRTSFTTGSSRHYLYYFLKCLYIYLFIH